MLKLEGLDGSHHSLSHEGLVLLLGFSDLQRRVDVVLGMPKKLATFVQRDALLPRDEIDPFSVLALTAHRIDANVAPKLSEGIVLFDLPLALQSSELGAALFGVCTLLLLDVTYQLIVGFSGDGDLARNLLLEVRIVCAVPVHVLVVHLLKMLERREGHYGVVSM